MIFVCRNTSCTSDISVPSLEYVVSEEALEGADHVALDRGVGHRHGAVEVIQQKKNCLNTIIMVLSVPANQFLCF